MWIQSLWSFALLKAAMTRKCWFVNKLGFMQRPASCGLFRCEIASELPGITVLSISGNRAWELFRGEAGGHRWQRIPPTERRGRTQTSTFTVAVFQEKPTRTTFSLLDVEFQTTKGSGPGGQHRNKTESAVRAIHRPTNTVVFCQNGRSQHSNKAEAIKLLKKKIDSLAATSTQQKKKTERLSQIGSGQRGDKVRTVQVQNGRVVNHLNSRKMSLKLYRNGEIWRLNE